MRARRARDADFPRVVIERTRLAAISRGGHLRAGGAPAHGRVDREHAVGAAAALLREDIVYGILRAAAAHNRGV